MERQAVNVVMPAELVQALDEQASRRLTTRSTLVRQAVALFLGAKVANATSPPPAPAPPAPAQDQEA